MYKRQQSFITPPDINSSEFTFALEFAGGALHQQVFTEDGQTRTVMTRVLVPPAVMDVGGNLRYEQIERFTSNNTIPLHAFDYQTSTMYVVCEFTTRTQFDPPVRISLLVIDPRSHTLANRYDIEVAPFGGSLTLPSPTRLLLGADNELHVFCGTTCVTIDVNLLTEKCRYTDPVAYEPLTTSNEFFTLTSTISGVDIQKFTRSINTGVATFTPAGGPVLAEISREGLDIRYGLDYDTGNVWVLASAMVDDNVTVGLQGTIAARWTPSTNAIMLIPKRPNPVPGTTYFVHSPMVVNSDFYFNTQRVLNGAAGYGLTRVRPDGASSFVLSYYGENTRLTGAAYSFDPTNRMGVLYPMSNGFAYASDDEDVSALYGYDLRSGHKTPDVFHFAGGTAYSRSPIYHQAHDTHVSLRSSILVYEGFGGTRDKRPPLGIPGDTESALDVVWDTTAPTVVSVITPPLQPFQVLDTPEYGFPEQLDPITDGPITPNWHRIVHTGAVTTVVYLAQERNPAFDNFFREDISRMVHAVLYDSNGRAIQRLRAGDAQYMFTGQFEDLSTSGVGKSGFVLPSYLPAGNYYLGVLPGLETVGRGTTFFSDYEYVGYSGEVNNALLPTYDVDFNYLGDVFTPLKYRISVQTYLAEAVRPIPCTPVNHPGMYPWEQLVEVNADLTPTWTELYNDPLLNGVNFNINLGGLPASWEPDLPDEVQVYIGQDPGLPFDYLVSGMVLNGTGDTLNIDLWTPSNAYLISDPTTLARYTQLPYFEGPTPVTGHTVFEGVATYPGFDAYIQPRFCNGPILYEQWYSLNPNRTDPTIGYDGYTFMGDAPNVVFDLFLDDTDPTAYVRFAAIGDFKLNADLATAQPSDCVAGVLVRGDINGCTFQLCLNGVVVEERIMATGPCTALQYGVDYILDGNISRVGQGKSFVEYVSMYTYDPTFASVNFTGSYSLTTEEPDVNKGLIDTRRIKKGFYVDAPSSGTQGVYNPNTTMYYSPGMAYTIPNRPVPCNYSLSFEYIPQVAFFEPPPVEQ